MVPAQSSIRTIDDLKGKTIAVAGGPIDKSWLLLQAFARRSGLDLRKQATPVYGAPPLLSQKALQGETDATLTFWNFCAELEGKGFRRAVAMDEVMKGLGAKRRGLRSSAMSLTKPGRRAIATRSAASSRSRLRPRKFLRPPTRIGSASRHASAQPTAPHWRSTGGTMLEGIPRRPIAEEADDARTLYRVLAEIGGADLVGPAKELDPGTFYRPIQGE